MAWTSAGASPVSMREHPADNEYYGPVPVSTGVVWYQRRVVGGTLYVAKRLTDESLLMVA